MRRRLPILVAAVLLGGCGHSQASDEWFETAASRLTTTTIDSKPVVTGSTTTTEPRHADPRPTRLAYSDGRSLWVLDEHGDAIDVGPSGTPVWSSDGRYLAWSTRERDGDAPPPKLNEPESWTVRMLDTDLGRRAEYRSSERPLAGKLFAVGDRFVATLSGRNNLGQDATDFVTFDFGDLESGQVSGPIHARFDLERPTHEYDFEWASIQGNDLYVVVTDTSTVHYRYNPQLWRVALSGLAGPVHMQKKAEGFQNISMAPVAVSPDSKYIVFTAGARSGICYYGAWPLLLRNADGAAQRIDGLSMQDSDRSSLWVDSVQWTSADTYLLSLRIRPLDCNDAALPTSEHLYRCTVADGCADTGVASQRASESRHGDLAYYEPYKDVRRTNLVVRWRSDKVQRFDVATWSSLAWSS